MFFQYIRTSMSNIKKNPLNYCIAIISLVIGFTLLALLLSYVLYHFNYDKNIESPDKWYRLRLTETPYHSQPENYSKFNLFMVKGFIKSVPEIEDYTYENEFDFSANFKNEKGTAIPLVETSSFVSPNITKLYQMKFIYGDKDSALTRGSSLIISRSYAIKYFGKVNALGEKTYLNGKQNCIVSGVFEDLPDNLHSRKDAYRFYTVYDIDQGVDVKDLPFYSKYRIYIKISDKRLVPGVEYKINQYMKQYENATKIKRTCHIDPLSKIHFMQGLKDDKKTINIHIIYASLIFGLLLFLTAFLNFFNLNVLAWEKRSDEFYLRKTLGASKKDLIFQLMTEYSFVYLIGICMSLLLYYIAKDIFNEWIQLNVTPYSLFKYLPTTLILAVLVLLAWLIVFIPAIKIACLNENQEDKRIKKRDFTYKMILSIQIFICVIFIISALITYSQSIYIKNYDIGYNPKQLLQYNHICSDRESFTKPSFVKQELEKIPEITEVTLSDFDIANTKPDLKPFASGTILTKVNNKDIIGKSQFIGVYDNFFNVMDVKIIKGNIKEINPFKMGDLISEVIINQAFADYFFPNIDPIGKEFKFLNIEEKMLVKIKAMIKDVHFKPLYEKVQPCFFIINQSFSEFVQIRYKKGTRDITIKKVNALFDSITHDSFYSYSYKDIENEIKAFYKEDIVLMNLIILFACVSLLIAIFGTYSISSLHIFNQMKEISIHKVNGADLKDLIKRYLKPYLYFSLISSVGGIVLAFYITDLFIRKYNVSISFIWIYYILSIVIIQIIVSIPVIYNIKKAFDTQVSMYINGDN